MVEQKNIIWGTVAAVGVGVALFFVILQKGEEKTDQNIQQPEKRNVVKTVPTGSSPSPVVKEEKRAPSKHEPIYQSSTASAGTSETLNTKMIEKEIQEGKLTYETDRSGYRREFYSESGRYTVSVVVPKHRSNDKEVSYALPPAVPVVMDMTLPNGETLTLSIKNGYEKGSAIVKIVDKESGEVSFKTVKAIEKEKQESEGKDGVPLTPPPVPTL